MIPYGNLQEIKLLITLKPTRNVVIYHTDYHIRTLQDNKLIYHTDDHVRTLQDNNVTYHTDGHVRT